MKERQRFRDGEEPLVGKADFHDAGTPRLNNAVVLECLRGIGCAKFDADWVNGLTQRLNDALAASASAPAAAPRGDELRKAIASQFERSFTGDTVEAIAQMFERYTATAERPAGTPHDLNHPGWKAYMETNEEVCQILGKALGYPWYKDDQANFPGTTEANGVCVGDHVAESIAAEAANRIAAQPPAPKVGAEAQVCVVCGKAGAAWLSNKEPKA